MTSSIKMPYIFKQKSKIIDEYIKLYYTKKKKEKVQQVIPQKGLRLHKKANRIHLPFEEQ